VVVSDQYHKLGLGKELPRRVIAVARDAKLSRVSAEMLTDNVAMQAITKHLGFRSRANEDPTSVRAFLTRGSHWPGACIPQVIHRADEIVADP
jgi:acetyltransferase